MRCKRASYPSLALLVAAHGVLFAFVACRSKATIPGNCSTGDEVALGVPGGADTPSRWRSICACPCDVEVAVPYAGDFAHVWLRASSSTGLVHCKKYVDFWNVDRASVPGLPSFVYDLQANGSGEVRYRVVSEGAVLAVYDSSTKLECDVILPSI